MKSVKTIAHQLGVDRETVRRWVVTGKLKGTLLPKGENHSSSGQDLYVVKESDLMEFLNQNEKYRERMFNYQRKNAQHYSDLKDLDKKLKVIRKKIEELQALVDELEV